MDRIASLRLAAQQLRVSLFRSLPLGFRVAHAIVRASGTGSVLGTIFGAIFLKAGVEGMPNPGPRWKPDSPRAADTLPSGYYASFGEDLFRTMLRKYRDVEFVEDTIMSFVADRALVSSLDLREGATEREARGLVFRALDRYFIDKLRVVQHRKKLMPTGPAERTDDEGSVTTVDFDDPRSLHEFEGQVTDNTVRKIKREIAKIVPWAPGWFDMLMDDHKDTEIIGDPVKGRPSLLAQELGLDTPYLPAPSGKPMTIPMWSNNYKPKIMEKIKEVYADS